MLDYPVELTPDDNGTLLVTAPDFPELTTFGEGRKDALARAEDALEEAIAGRIAHRNDVPRPSRGRVTVTLGSLTAVKVLLYRGMREQGVGKAELARRLNWHLPQVDRALDIGHKSRLDQLDAALLAIGLQLRISAQHC
ncbi:MAG: type II toxin-antitoxin system HicB family antitoxin [Alphaproteobacteria bacterium]|nr:type II toxin-antitoxin system HicB family antitoxin [Alphaproteobacteria bacterium]